MEHSSFTRQRHLWLEAACLLLVNQRAASSRLLNPKRSDVAAAMFQGIIEGILPVNSTGHVCVALRQVQLMAAIVHNQVNNSISTPQTLCSWNGAGWTRSHKADGTKLKFCNCWDLLSLPNTWICMFMTSLRAFNCPPMVKNKVVRIWIFEIEKAECAYISLKRLF